MKAKSFRKIEHVGLDGRTSPVDDSPPLEDTLNAWLCERAIKIIGVYTSTSFSPAAEGSLLITTLHVIYKDDPYPDITYVPGPYPIYPQQPFGPAPYGPTAPPWTISWTGQQPLHSYSSGGPTASGPGAPDAGGPGGLPPGPSQ